MVQYRKWQCAWNSKSQGGKCDISSPTVVMMLVFFGETEIHVLRQHFRFPLAVRLTHTSSYLAYSTTLTSEGVKFNIPPDTTGHFRDNFYGLHSPTNSVKALKDDCGNGPLTYKRSISWKLAPKKVKGHKTINISKLCNTVNKKSHKGTWVTEPN